MVDARLRIVPRAALAAALIAALAPRAAAQETRPIQRSRVDLHDFDPQPTKPGRRFLDRIAATINERVVLESYVRAAVADAIVGLEGAGNVVTMSDAAEAYRKVLQGAIDAEALAQSALTSTGQTPEEVREVVARELQRFQDEQVKEFGSFNQYMRDLAALGKNWDTVAQEQQDQTLRDISLYDLYRLVPRSSLIVTPREMKQYYERNRDLFVSEESTDVARLYFEGKDAGARARAAAEAWRREPTRSDQEIAAAFNARALPERKGVRAGTSDSAAIRRFAQSAKEGEVGDPIEDDSAFWLLKALKKQAGKNEPFNDAKVQAGIMDHLAEIRRTERVTRLRMLNKSKLNIWTPNASGR